MLQCFWYLPSLPLPINIDADPEESGDKIITSTDP